MPVETTGHAEKEGGDNGLQRELVEVGNPFSTTVQITFEASRRSLAHAHEGDQPLHVLVAEPEEPLRHFLEGFVAREERASAPKSFWPHGRRRSSLFLVRVHIISLDHCHGNHIRNN